MHEDFYGEHFLADCPTPEVDVEEKNNGGLFWVFCLLFAVIAIIIALFCPSFTKKAHADMINVKAIAQMESSGNPLARNGSHYGLCQIGMAVLKDYNKAHKTALQINDLYNSELNMKIAEWYLEVEIPRMLRHFNLEDTAENRITAWRLGVGSVLNGKKATRYFNRYSQLKTL